MVKRLAQNGWTVSEQGDVVRPDGTIRQTKIAKGKGNRPDYRAFNVKHERVSTPVRVHKLVAYQKFGDEALEEQVVVRHLNGDSLDNKPGNIAIGTHSDNAFDRPLCDRAAHALKAAAVTRRFSDQDVRNIRDITESTTSLAIFLEVPKSSISQIRNRKTYKHVH